MHPLERATPSLPGAGEGDADVCAVRPALDSPDVEIWTDAFVSGSRLIRPGRATGVIVERGGEQVEVEADFVAVACGVR